MMKCIKALAPLFGMLLAAPCMAQPRWEILMGEDYGPQQTLPVADPWKTDRSLACAQCTDHGFIVNGTFIGMVPVGSTPTRYPRMAGGSTTWTPDPSPEMALADRSGRGSPWTPSSMGSG